MPIDFKALVEFISKVAPWLAVAVAWFKGKKDQRLESKLETSEKVSDARDVEKQSASMSRDELLADIGRLSDKR